MGWYALGVLMAVITYSSTANLNGFYAWARANGVPPAVPCPQGNVLEIIAKHLTRGTYAEAGDSVRYSAFLTSGDAVIDFGGQWADDEGNYKRYNHTLAVSAGGSPARFIAPASAGWYRDAAASLRTAGITGQTLYVTQELGRTDSGEFKPIAMLAQGFLTSQAPVSDRPNIPPSDGGGGGGGGCCIGVLHFDVAIGTTSVTFPIAVAAGSRGRLVQASAALTTDSGGGNRLAVLNAFPALWDGYSVYASTPQPGGVSHGYVWQISGDRHVPTGGANDYMPLPAEYWWSEDFTVVLTMDNPESGDTWGVASFTWEIQGP